MDILAFLAWAFVLVHAVALAWPVNIGFMALAFKVQNGPAPLPMESNEFLWRSAFAALGQAALSLVTVGIAYFLVGKAELPGGPVHLVLLLVYVPIAVAYLFWMYALDDVLQALGVYACFVLLPGILVLAAAWFFKLFDKVREHAPWLLATS